MALPDERTHDMAEFRALADALPDIVWSAPAHGPRADFVNRKWYELAGESHADPARWRDLMHPDDRPRVVAHWERCLAEGLPFESEFRLAQAGTQNYRWYVARAVPARDHAGTVVRWYGVNTDIHEWKQSVDLGASVALERERTEREIREQAAALAEADRNKDQFLAKLAHELRNPLGAARAAIQVLQARVGSDPAAARPLAILERQMAHLVHLIDDLRDVSQIARGELRLHREPVDVRAILADAVETIRPALTSRQQLISVALPSDAVAIDGDSARLTQIFLNVLNNAARYTGDGGSIDITMDILPDDVVVRVRDNGIGIAPEMLQAIFELYTRTSNAEQYSESGIGIGLHMVKTLVGLHGGSVTATSPGVGRGSMFEIRLPLAAAAV